jgi:phosphatidylglycerophosphatase A
MPFASGTWGSLPVAGIFLALSLSGVPTLTISIVMVLIAIAASLACILFSPEVIERTGNKDPSEVVADEVAGQAVTYICAASIASVAGIAATAVGFLAFRFFDILKPPPCRRLEKLPKGFGILADDIMAGVYAAIVLQICIRTWIAGLN